MKPQNYSNHTRFVPFFHFFLFGLLLITFILALVQVSRAFADEETELLSVLVLMMNVAFIFLFFFTRIFALKAQDRAIRAEENLRHFSITGKLLPEGLNIKQIVALRFASDQELPILAASAANEKLSGKEIKKRVIEWREDKWRV